MSIEHTLNERQKAHEKFENHVYISQRLKRQMRESEKWVEMPPPMRESLEMIAHKIARILNGDPMTADHWHDIAGYATLVERLIGGDK